MKKLLLTAALVAAVATPALAQSFDPDYGTGNVDAPLASMQSPYAGNTFAYAPRGDVRLERRVLRTPSVYQDPNIALQQRRDDHGY